MTSETPLEYVAPEFGPAIKRWFACQGLTQQTPHSWGKAAGVAGPWNSQLSRLQRNLLACEPGFFISLAQFNRAIAGEIALPASLERMRRDQIEAAEPFRLQDGSLPSPSQWFALYIGELPIPEQYLAPAVVELPESVVAAAKTLADLPIEQRQQLLALLSA